MTSGHENRCSNVKFLSVSTSDVPITNLTCVCVSACDNAIVKECFAIQDSFCQAMKKMFYLFYFWKTFVLFSEVIEYFSLGSSDHMSRQFQITSRGQKVRQTLQDCSLCCLCCCAITGVHSLLLAERSRIVFRGGLSSAMSPGIGL